MSANNQAEPEPAAAVPAAAAAAAEADAGSGPASPALEYLKRTCLICGCQTNQTINIYEPRSGPNIVQLIQAKFKFQPLNEDKFLCFSCNNWLINWHSLQALNSNDAESQSRSQSPSHMGNNCGNNGRLRQQQRGQPLQQRGSGKQRPVAHVRPQPQAQSQMQAQALAQRQSQTVHTQTVGQTRTPHPPRAPSMPAPTPTPTPTPAPEPNYKRSFGKRLRRCCSRQRRCVRNESELCKWRTLHQRSLRKVAQLQRALQLKQRQQSLVKLPAHQKFTIPRVDGKVVAMFRRLGTTLSTEEESQGVDEEVESELEQREPKPSPRPLRIMSPAKQRPRWTRTLEDDEILLEFDSVISEVLPTSTLASTTARRRLRYQLTAAAAAGAAVAAKEEAEMCENNRKANHRAAQQMNLSGLQLPQGLSITLI